MTGVVIYERNGFRLTSFGNGWAYLLEWLDETGKRAKSVWMQDEDASTFRGYRFDPAFSRDDSDDAIADVFSTYEDIAQTDENAR